jgi:hypothetical protein
VRLRSRVAPRFTPLLGEAVPAEEVSASGLMRDGLMVEPDDVDGADDAGVADNAASAAVCCFDAAVSCTHDSSSVPPYLYFDFDALVGLTTQLLFDAAEGGVTVLIAGVDVRNGDEATADDDAGADDDEGGIGLLPTILCSYGFDDVRSVSIILAAAAGRLLYAPFNGDRSVPVDLSICNFDAAMNELNAGLTAGG